MRDIVEEVFFSREDRRVENQKEIMIKKEMSKKEREKMKEERDKKIMEG